MSVVGMDHFNVSGDTAMIETLRQWYTEVIGLQEGPRPQVRTPGYWMYAGERAILHLTDLGEDRQGQSNLNHIALHCEDLPAWESKLAAHGITPKRAELAELRQVQLFFQDPAGVTLELNFKNALPAPTA